MNKKLEELYQEAERSVQFLSNSKESKEKIILERYGELIVQECIKVCQCNTSPDLQPYHRGMVDGYKRARENIGFYFNVKEPT